MGSVSRLVPWKLCAGSALRLVAVRWSRYSGRTVQARQRLVDILSTLTRPDRGKASIAGFDVVSDPASVRRSIMLTGQQVALDDVLTGRENLVLFGRLQGLE